jgi:hypothetical protein
MINVYHSLSSMALSNWTSAAPFLFHQALWKTSGRRLDNVEKIREEEVMSERYSPTASLGRWHFLIEQLPGAANEAREACRKLRYLRITDDIGVIQRY